MSRTFVTKTSFTAGELDPHLLGRLDLKAQEEGAARLRNVLVQATGGVTRRPGLARVARIDAACRLISFEAAFGPALVVLGPSRIDIVRNDNVITGPASVWTTAQLGEIVWAISGKRLLITHPSVAPRMLVERTSGTFELQAWSFETSGEDTPKHVYQPYGRFAPQDVLLELQDRSTHSNDDELDPGPVDLVASVPVFDPQHIGSIIRYRGTEVAIVTIDPLNRTRATGLLRQKVENGRPTTAWDEQAFSALRGWPATVSVYQDRLVIGGSRDLPNHMWLSRTGRHFNFDLGGTEGEVLADDAIAFRLAADDLHVIRGLQPGRQLQVFTGAGEWIVRGVPVTPSTVELELQTRVGSWAGRRLRPTEVDGATLFVGASGRELREFLFSDSEQAYQAADIALLARRLLDSPVDIAFDGRRRLLIIPRADGHAAVTTIDRNSNVVGWSLLETEGSFEAVTIHSGEPWFLVERGSAVMLERFDDGWTADHARLLTSSSNRTSWTGLGELEGLDVVAQTAAGTLIRGRVSGGSVTSPPTTQLRVGVPFQHEIEPMPLAVPSGRGVSGDHPFRPVRTSFRLLESAALYADLGDGPQPVLAPTTAAFTGDVGVRSLGWRRGLGLPIWRVVQDDPLPSTILSVTTEIKVND
jgi:hypothetical protein